jgi:hypothetical protein
LNYNLFSRDSLSFSYFIAEFAPRQSAKIYNKREAGECQEKKSQKVGTGGLFGFL